MPTDRLARKPWELGIGWQAPHTAANLHSSDGALARLSLRAKRTVGSSIRLSLRINISLTIGETYKMVEDFTRQFSPLYLSMKYLAIISRHPVYKKIKLFHI